MATKAMVLYTINTQVFVELAEDYLLYVCEEELFSKKTPSEIVLLADQVIMEHTRASKPY